MFNIPAGYAASRFGSRVVVAASMLICSAAAYAMLAAEGFVGLLLAQLFAGLGSSCFNVGVSSLLRDTVPGHFRGRVVSIKGGLGRIAMFVANAVAGLTAARYCELRNINANFFFFLLKMQR